MVTRFGKTRLFEQKLFLELFVPDESVLSRLQNDTNIKALAAMVAEL